MKGWKSIQKHKPMVVVRKLRKVRQTTETIRCAITDNTKTRYYMFKSDGRSEDARHTKGRRCVGGIENSGSATTTTTGTTHVFKITNPASMSAKFQSMKYL